MAVFWALCFHRDPGRGPESGLRRSTAASLRAKDGQGRRHDKICSLPPCESDAGVNVWAGAPASGSELRKGIKCLKKKICTGASRIVATIGGMGASTSQTVSAKTERRQAEYATTSGSKPCALRRIGMCSSNVCHE